MSSSNGNVRVFVTGASGFIGRAISYFFVQQNIPVSFERCDIHNFDHVSDRMENFRPTHFLHLAWITGLKYAHHKDNLKFLNSSINLINSFYGSGGRRFVGVGSCYEYAHGENALNEMKSPTRPETLYGMSKLALATYLETVAGVYEKSWAWCRPFYITGPGEASYRLVPEAILTLQNHQSFFVKNPNSKLDFMDVRDVARAIFAILFSEHCKVVNIGSGECINIVDLIEILKSIMNSKSDIFISDTPQKQCTILADINSLKEDFKFTSKYSLYDSLTASVAYMQGR